MNSEAFKSVDVAVFGEILNKKNFIGEMDENSQKDILSFIRKIHKMEIVVPGLEINRQKIANKIKFTQYGFRERGDVKYEFSENIFEDYTIVNLIPMKIYDMEDNIKLPAPLCENGKILNTVLTDAFERLKVKAHNIILNTGNDEQIIHYARKNIQMAQRLCYESRVRYEKIQHGRNMNSTFLAYMISIFMIRVISFLQKMFSNYYKDITADKEKYKAEMFEAIDMNIIMEPTVKYGNVCAGNFEAAEPIKFVCNGQINALITVFYEMMRKDVGKDKKFLEGEDRAVELLLSKFFVDKAGKPINPDTVKKCMKDYNEEKRANGNKKIEVNYLLK